MKSGSEVSQSRLTLCDRMDCSLPCSSVCGILQARILEWVAMSSSRGFSQLRDQIQVSLIEGGFSTKWATREAQWQTATVAATTTKSLQSCPTLCNPIDGSPRGFPTPGILQARTLEWVAISFSNAWKWKVKVKLLSRVRLSATPWTTGYQAPPSMEVSRQECWSGLPLPSPYMQSTSYEMLGSIKHKLESRLLGEISITSDLYMSPSLWQKLRRTKKPLDESESCCCC